MNDDDMDDRNDCIQVTLTRSPLHGFGISIGAGHDDMDTHSLIVSDVIKNGPADGKLLANDRIVNVNGHPVVRFMEYTALKLIRESTDFVHLIVQRRKHPVTVSEKQSPIRRVVHKMRKEEKLGIVLDCRYFVKKVYLQPSDKSTIIHEGDEVIKINEIPIDRLSLQEAQKLIDKSKDQLVLYTVPNKLLNNHQPSTVAYRQLQSEYSPHVFERVNHRPAKFPRPNSGSRYVSFFTETSSIGIRLAGGNKYGLFICEIQPNSVAYKAGLFVTDKIFSVNNIDFAAMTREEAVVYLTNLRTSQVNMIVSNLPHEYEQLLTDVGGDSFYIRAHFTWKASTDEQVSVGINDVFHVTDTLYNGQVGHWVGTKLNALASQTKLTGAIPSQSRAEELAAAAPSLDTLIKSKQSSLKKTLRSRFHEKRSRSVLSLNQFKEDSVFNKATCWKPLVSSTFPAYERVKLKTITIIRPVVLLGPLADIARDRLLTECPDQFELPQTHLQSTNKTCPNIIKLQSIRDVIQKNRHCLLDITPSAIEQLNHAECYPIVVYFRFADRRVVKQIRHQYGKAYQRSSRRLFETSEYLEHFYSYLFTSIINVDSAGEWYDALKSHVDLQQEQPLWMNYDQSIDPDFLQSNDYFVSTRSNYADEFVHAETSNREFDALNRKGKNHLQRVASDPVMFPNMSLDQSFSTNLPHEIEDEDIHRFIPLPNRCHSVIEMSTIDGDHIERRSASLYPHTPLLYQRSLQHSATNTNDGYSFRADKPSNNRHSMLSSHRDSYLSTQPKIISSNSWKTLNVSGAGSLRQPSMASKLRTISSIEQLSSSDSNASIRKNLLDKSTMTTADPNSAVNYYPPCTRSAASRSTIFGDPCDSERLTSIDANDRFCTESLLKQKMCSSKKHNHSHPTDPIKPALLPTASLQKPRVYTYDDQQFLLQQQQLSSSSGSSTFSSKEKNLKEVGETSSYGIQDGFGVLGSARGVMDYFGGKLSCPVTGVSLFVPVGAIREGVRQEIYFQVCQDDSHLDKIDGQLLSPIVLCGPRGIQFDKPVELTLPHSAGHTAQHLSLTLHGTNPRHNVKTNCQQQTQPPMTNGIHHVTNTNVSVLVDHF